MSMEMIREQIADYESERLSNKSTIMKSRAESFVRFDNALREAQAEAWDKGLELIGSGALPPATLEVIKRENPFRAPRSARYLAAVLFIDKRLAFTEVEMPWTDAEGLKSQHERADEVEEIMAGLTLPEALQILELGE